MQWEEEKPKCPACGAVAAAGALECAGCGVVFAKWKAKQDREQAPSGRSLAEPPPVLVRETDQTGSLAAKGAGVAVLAAAAALTGWLLSSGSARPSVAGAVEDPVHGFSAVAPAGWNERPLPACGKGEASCVVRLYARSDDAKDRYPEWIELRAVARKGADRARLEDELASQVRDGVGEGSASPPKRPVYDGAPGYGVEGRGRKHFHVQTAAAVAMTAQAALAEQQRLNPNKGVYSVMASYNPRSLNPSVTVKEAEFADFDARPVQGRLLVPARDYFLVLAYQCDEAEEAAVSRAVEEILSSLRILKRARGMDDLGGGGAAAAFGLVAALALAGLKLLAA